ncbi:MAG: DUF3306 domain-containing protein [Aeromicrobium sp.]|nr:DUF3306 domain-containing protein [Burkholderiales bacterium]
MSEGGLFSRWAKRKQDVAAQNASESIPSAPSALGNETVAPTLQVDGAVDERIGASGSTVQPQPLPAIESLTAESNFAPFMAKDVSPDLRNQAMKKLFADPHYNVMDGLDIYIDDYGKPDPLPEGWLQIMNQSKTLRLFETKEEEAARLGTESVVVSTNAVIAVPAQSQDISLREDLTPPNQPAVSSLAPIAGDASLPDSCEPSDLPRPVSQRN